MLFVVDIGNSHTVTGVYKGDNLIGHWRLKSDRQRTSDEIAIRHYALFKMVGIDANSIENIIISSVVPTLETAWLQSFKQYFSKNLTSPPFIVTDQSVRSLIKIVIDNPKEVGADRLVNGIAAWQKNKCSTIVIDFGTAITFDCISKDCQYLGGAILPGINLGLEALATKTAKLPHIDISQPPEKVIGTNTVDAMKGGVLFGYGAMVDGLISKMREEMNVNDEPFKVIATGGLAEIITPYTKYIDRVEPLLTLEGLKIIQRMSK